MQRSFSASGAIGIAGLLALLIAQPNTPGHASDGDSAPLAPTDRTSALVSAEPLSGSIDSTKIKPAVRSAASTTPARDRPVTTVPAPTTAPRPSAPGAVPARDAVALTNEQRQAARLPGLTTDSTLTAAAAQHSADQASRNSMGHEGSDGSSMVDRVRANGGSFDALGENVAAGYDTASAVVDGWMNSPGHRANIVNPAFSRIGVAVATASDGTAYWTMVLSG